MLTLKEAADDLANYFASTGAAAEGAGNNVLPGVCVLLLYQSQRAQPAHGQSTAAAAAAAAAGAADTDSICHQLWATITVGHYQCCC